jgi:hypothetical protein
MLIQKSSSVSITSKQLILITYVGQYLQETFVCANLIVVIKMVLKMSHFLLHFSLT